MICTLGAVCYYNSCMTSETETYPAREEQLIQLLEKSDITPTSQRVEIADILLTKAQHMSADQVLASVREHGANVSKATVYNTLNLFASKGLVRELIIDGGKIFFDSNTTDHHHFYNEETNELMDFGTNQLLISTMPNPPEGTVRTGVEVIVKIKKL